MTHIQTSLSVSHYSHYLAIQAFRYIKRYHGVWSGIMSIVEHFLLYNWCLGNETSSSCLVHCKNSKKLLSPATSAQLPVYPNQKIQLNNKFKVVHVCVYHSIKVPMDKREGVLIHTIKNTESTDVRKKRKKTNRGNKTQQTTRRKTKISGDQQR